MLKVEKEFLKGLAARDGDAAVVAEVELIVLETEEPAALTRGSDDI